MGKKARVVVQRRPTKRQLSRWQKEKQVQHFILAGGAFVILLVLSIPAFGFAREFVFKGREPVARVEENVFTLSEYASILSLRTYLLDSQIDNLQRALGQSGGQLQTTLQRMESLRASLPNQVVSDWISEQLIRQEASRQGLTVGPAEVTEAIRSEFDPVPEEGSEPKPLSEEEFQSRYRDFLTRARTTDALYRKQREFTLLAQKLESRLQEQVPSQGPQVHLQAILVGTEEIAQDASARLEGGEDFAQVAQEVSLDTPSKEKGGDIGWVPRGLLEKEAEEAAFSLKVGQTSPPLDTAQGFYILKALEREESREIEASLLDRLKSNVLDQWLEQAQEKVVVERYLTSDKVTWAEKQNRKR